MKKIALPFFFILSPFFLHAQKKPLDHSVYDQWQSVPDKKISNDGKWFIYTITPQEGDAETIIQSFDKTSRLVIPRGYTSTITEDSKYAIVKIRPYFKVLRDARIKRRPADDMPKDSLAIITLGKNDIHKIARIKSYKTPAKAGGTWVSYLFEKGVNEPRTRNRPDSSGDATSLSKTIDSLLYVADSLRNLAEEMKVKGVMAMTPAARRDSAGGPSARAGEEGTDLVLHNLSTGVKKQFSLVSDYYFNEQGTIAVISTTKKNKDPYSKAAVLWVNLATGKTDTIFKRFNDVRNLAIQDDGSQLAFIAERDSTAKGMRRFYKLWYYKPGMDSAVLKVDTTTAGVAKGLTVNENVRPVFSKDGKKLFFSIFPIRRQKNNDLVEFETARLDVWNYKDDYLQPQQLVNLNRELRRGYMAVLHIDLNKTVQLGADDAEDVNILNEGNADYVLATSTKGNRVEAQWMGFSARNGYLISTLDGSRKKIKEKEHFNFSASPEGKYISWYDASDHQYYTYKTATGETKNITKSIPEGLFNDEEDTPSEPAPYGMAGWVEKDKAVLINDKFDVWQVDPDGIVPPVNVTNAYGKKNSIVLRAINFDRAEAGRGRRDSIGSTPLKPNQLMVFAAFNKKTKYAGFYSKTLDKKGDPAELVMSPNTYMQPEKAANADAFIVTKASFSDMDVYTSKDLKTFAKVSSLNEQQKNYNWLTAELVKWEMFDGKESEGILFKPENFDSTKKYPVLFYFYEKLSDGLYTYREPSPSRSAVNVPYFASNEYLVFLPDIPYKTGQPGEDAYNSVGSAAKFLSKRSYVDSTKLAIQGHSWGGYQVAYLVTRTNMFAVAMSGAPVANMTSAYGGIRWTTGLNRQFQYEHTQSRIGVNLWDSTELYIKNSPLFSVPKINTPLLIMHNDEDGSVPWYQGIELFTALRRLNKPVWMLEYNGEDHGLQERKNRKDFSVRLGQYFAHFLKGAPAPTWLTDGVPATLKGIDWGLDTKPGAATDVKKSF